MISYSDFSWFRLSVWVRCAYLLSLGACAHYCSVFRAAYSLVRSNQLCLWCGHHCTKENEAHGVSPKNSIVNIVENNLGEFILETHMHVGMAHGYSWSYITRSLALMWTSLREASMRTRRNLTCFLISQKMYYSH